MLSSDQTDIKTTPAAKTATPKCAIAKPIVLGFKLFQDLKSFVLTLIAINVATAKYAAKASPRAPKIDFPTKKVSIIIIAIGRINFFNKEIIWPSEFLSHFSKGAAPINKINKTIIGVKVRSKYGFPTLILSPDKASMKSG